ncbi:MAG TPA: hypothetical protein VFX02_09480 [Gammaproteobacteria bacterium]|nr:hypothetical protein [Gammaproteobacteria bacterium]
MSVKAFDYDLKLGPVVTGTLLVLAVLGVMFFSLYAHRIQTLYRADYSPCAQYRNLMDYKTYMQFSKCLGIQTRDYLKHPQWLAAQFACFMFAAIMSGIFCGWLTGSQRQVSVPLIAAISAMAASVIFKPWGLVTVAALLGVPLGGAIFQVFSKRRG